MLNETNDIQSTEEKNSVEKEGQSFLKETFRFALVALLVVIPIRVFIAQPFIVSGASMDPTFETGEYLIVDEISYRFDDPQRGDVIVFKFPSDTSKFFIKRIVGIPGEIVKIQNGEVTIVDKDSNEIKIQEDYVVHKSFDNLITTLVDEEYFVMGDNRSDSLDSRSWGPLHEDFIKGKAFLRLVPLKKIGVLPGAIK
jgi:signal peptidase I